MSAPLSSHARPAGACVSPAFETASANAGLADTNVVHSTPELLCQRHHRDEMTSTRVNGEQDLHGVRSNLGMAHLVVHRQFFGKPHRRSAAVTFGQRAGRGDLCLWRLEGPWQTVRSCHPQANDPRMLVGGRP